MRGRPRKFKVGDVVRIKRENLGVIVAYQDVTKSNRYGVKKDCDVTWLDSHELEPVGRRAPLVVRRWRQTQGHEPEPT